MGRPQVRFASSWQTRSNQNGIPGRTESARSQYKIVALVEFSTPLEKDEEFRGFQTPGCTSTGERGEVPLIRVQVILHGGRSAHSMAVSA
jgi:hypothetical protein